MINKQARDSCNFLLICARIRINEAVNCNLARSRMITSVIYMFVSRMINNFSYEVCQQSRELSPVACLLSFMAMCVCNYGPFSSTYFFLKT